MWYTIMVTAWIDESHLLKWQKSSIAQNYIELPHFIMRHRQAVRQRTLTPPSQVRLLLAQLEAPARAPERASARGLFCVRCAGSSLRRGRRRRSASSIDETVSLPLGTTLRFSQAATSHENRLSARGSGEREFLPRSCAQKWLSFKRGVFSTQKGPSPR